jgi:hypothetical protein
LKKRAGGWQDRSASHPLVQTKSSRKQPVPMNIEQISALPQKQTRSRESLFYIALAFFQVGITAFGISIVQKIKVLVSRSD